MRVVVAPNALKDCLSAAEAARAMARGVRRALPEAEVAEIPVADGGDGLVEVWLSALGGERRRAAVTGPLGERVEAEFAWQPETGTAVIEMARASGLALLPADRRDPEKTTSLGTGELLRLALGLGARRVILGLGGSATNDGALGLAAALGAVALDAEGRPLSPVGGSLARMARLDLERMDRLPEGVELVAACDVDNPLAGPTGAAHVFAPQKGADAAMVGRLDAGLLRWGRLLLESTGRDVRELPGAGAAGGLGGGLAALLGARLRPGVDILLDALGLDAALRGAALALTAEGRLDSQTARGKAPAGVARRAALAGVPCVALAGQIGDGLDEWAAAGINAAFGLCDGPMSLEEAIRRAPELLEKAAGNVARLFFSAECRVKSVE